MGEGTTGSTMVFLGLGIKIETAGADVVTDNGGCGSNDANVLKDVVSFWVVFVVIDNNIWRHANGLQILLARAGNIHKDSVIMVAEDDPTIRKMIARAMEQEGYQVVEASNGEECLDK